MRHPSSHNRRRQDKPCIFHATVQSSNVQSLEQPLWKWTKGTRQQDIQDAVAAGALLQSTEKNVQELYRVWQGRPLGSSELQRQLQILLQVLPGPLAGSHQGCVKHLPLLLWCVAPPLLHHALHSRAMHT